MHVWTCKSCSASLCGSPALFWQDQKAAHRRFSSVVTRAPSRWIAVAFWCRFFFFWRRTRSETVVWSLIVPGTNTNVKLRRRGPFSRHVASSPIPQPCVTPLVLVRGNRWSMRCIYRGTLEPPKVQRASPAGTWSSVPLPWVWPAILFLSFINGTL